MLKFSCSTKFNGDVKVQWFYRLHWGCGSSVGLWKFSGSTEVWWFYRVQWWYSRSVVLLTTAGVWKSSGSTMFSDLSCLSGPNSGNQQSRQTTEINNSPQLHCLVCRVSGYKCSALQRSSTDYDMFHYNVELIQYCLLFFSTYQEASSYMTESFLMPQPGKM